ncbi:MAG: winged helix-turn-helix domain-containing protein [Paracoccaceae bacterium]|nr:winged helix-turn-helix domain-containing protein [Paracoccaceae bacterium]
MAKFYEFEDSGLVLDAETGRISSASGDEVEMRPQTREVLTILAGAPGKTVTKSEFTDAVWDGREVGGDSLVQCIKEIRAALGDDNRTVVRTVPRKGYKFVPPAEARRTAGTRRTWTIVALGSVAGLVALFVWAFLPGRSPQEVEGIAVLPLEDLSSEPHRGYLSDALSEGVITELARSPHFRVVARNSSFQFRDTPTDIRTIGEKLDVDYVVEGSQQFDGERIRVTIQLIETKTGSHVFADQIERDLDDLFVVQNLIVRQVSSAIGETMMLEIPQQAAPGDVGARLRGLQARKLATQLTRENWEKAMALEEQSIREEPDSAWGYIGKSLMLGAGVGMNWLEPKDEILAEAASLARTAMELAPENYMSHHTLGRVFSRQGKYEEAILQFERAAEINPSDPIVWIGMAGPLRFTGQTEQSLDVLEQAALVDPMHGDWLRAETALTLWQREECDEGLASIDSMANLRDYAYPIRISLLVCLDRAAEARETLATFLTRRPDYSLEKASAALPAIWLPEGTSERWMTGLRKAGLE